MSDTRRKRHMIRIDQLCVGLHVKLAGWLDHPFLFSNFKISSQDQIDALQAMGLDEIEYLPFKSDAIPRPAAPRAPEVGAAAAPPSAEGPAAAALKQLMEEKKAKIEKLNKSRARIQAAQKKYATMAGSVKNISRIAADKPAQAAAQAKDIAVEMAQIFMTEHETYLHLMSENVADESGTYFHNINVSMMSLLLARALGIDDAGTIAEIAQGAILHDVGKTLIPSQVLLKDDGLTQAESKLMNMHPAYGLQLMMPVESLGPRVREIIAFHHEMIDGSGYPKGLQGDAISQAVRIVTIANVFDNLCNQRVVARSKTPSEALAFMYKNELVKYDKIALSAFVKALGVYPPGTIVTLKSGKVGIVMSVDSSDLLHPNLMVYDPGVPKADAAIVNLRRDLEDEVDRTLRPSALPPAIHDYLSPRKRICYFVDNAGQWA
jgi:HD-GYP domain-containing protein (c-di-GMP phosphodiesterase class II)